MLFEAVALVCLSDKRPDTIVLVAVAVRCNVGSNAVRNTFSAQPALWITFWGDDLFGIDFDVSSRLEVSRLEIIDADTQDRFVY